MAIHDHRDVVVVADIGTQPRQHRIGHLPWQILGRAGQFVGQLVEMIGDVDAALLDQAVGVQHQCRPGIDSRGRLGTPAHVEGRQRYRPSALQQAPGPPRRREHRGHMPRTGIAQHTAGRIEDGGAHRGAHRARNTRGHRIQFGEQLGRSGAAQQQRLCGGAQLAHHHRRGQAAPDAISDHDAEGAVAQRHHVVPVPADLERGECGFVVHRETRRQIDRAEHRPLQCQRRRSHLVEVAGTLQRQTEMPDQQGQQRPIARTDRTGCREPYPQCGVTGFAERRHDAFRTGGALGDGEHRAVRAHPGAVEQCPRPRIDHLARHGVSGHRCGAVGAPDRPRHIQFRCGLAVRPHRDHGGLAADRAPQLLQADGQDLGHGGGRTDCGGQA